MGRIRLIQEPAIGVPTPSVSQDTIFFDSADGLPKYKDPTGAVNSFVGAAQAKLQTLVYDVMNDYGAKDDLITVFDGAMTATQTTLTCAASAPFLAGDVGKRVTVAGAGAGGAQLTTTIASFSSSSAVVLSAAAGTTVLNKGVSYGTDNTVAIQNAINAAGNAGGGVVWFPVKTKGRYGITSMLTVTKQGVMLWGPSGSFTTDIGDYTKSGGAWICWWATTSGTFATGAIIQISAIAGAGNQALIGSQIEGLSFDCRNGDQNQALYGIQGISCHGPHWRDFFIMDPLAVGIDTNVVTTLGEARDFARFRFERFCIRALDNPAGAVLSGVTTSSAVLLSTVGQNLTVNANTLPTSGFIWVETSQGYPVLVNYTGGGGTVTLTGCVVSAQEAINNPTTVNGSNVVQAVPGNACCVRVDGDATANTNLGTMDTCQLSHGTTWGPAAIEYRNCDSIDSMVVVINGGNVTNDGAINRIRKPGVRFNGSNTNAALAARNNTFRGGSAGAGGVSTMGVLNTGARLVALPQPNHWEGYQLGNGEPVPTIEGNAYFEYWLNGALKEGRQGAASVADQAIANALTLITGTLIAVPPQGFQVGTTIRFMCTGIQTAAALSVGVFTVRIGVNGTTADAAVMTVTLPAATAAVGTSFWIEGMLTIRTLGAAATVTGKLFVGQGTAAGIGGAATFQISVPTFATFNSTTIQQFIHLAFISGAAGTTLTFQQAHAKCEIAANP